MYRSQVGSFTDSLGSHHLSCVGTLSKSVPYRTKVKCDCFRSSLARVASMLHGLVSANETVEGEGAVWGGVPTGLATGSLVVNLLFLLSASILATSLRRRYYR